LVNFAVFSRGDGAPLSFGQVSSNPDGSLEGSTRKLKDWTPSWIFQKKSVIGFEQKRWYLS